MCESCFDGLVQNEDEGEPDFCSCDVGQKARQWYEKFQELSPKEQLVYLKTAPECNDDSGIPF